MSEPAHALDAKFECPMPPEHLHEIGFAIEPAKEVAEWFRALFIDEGAPFENPEHLHLRDADIAVLWTNVEYRDGQHVIAGTAEFVRVGGKPWAQARTIDHLTLLFGRIPDFIITLFAPAWVEASLMTRCGRIEHELCHCGQKIDRKTNLPKFDADGKPEYAGRPHDYEGFFCVTRRYGADAAEAGIAQLLEIARAKPEIGFAEVTGVCGTCRAKM